MEVFPQIKVVFTIFCIVMMAIGLLLLRNELIYIYRKRVIDWVYGPHPDMNEWKRRRTILERQNYDQMMWDWRKWTFKQFFPEV